MVLDGEPELNNNTKELTYRSGNLVIGNNISPGGPNTPWGTTQECRVQAESARGNPEHMRVLFKRKITRYYLRDTQEECAMRQCLSQGQLGELEADIYLWFCGFLSKP